MSSHLTALQLVHCNYKSKNDEVKLKTSLHSRRHRPKEKLLAWFFNWKCVLFFTSFCTTL